MPLVKLEDKTHKNVAQLAIDSEPKRTIKSVVEEAINESIPLMRKRLETQLRAAAQKAKKK